MRFPKRTNSGLWIRKNSTKLEGKMSFVPNTYEEWKHCITVKCDIPLTLDYVQERIAALTDDKDLHTQKFIERWARAHHKRALAWFRQAAEDLDQAA